MTARKYNRRVDFVLRPASGDITRKLFCSWLDGANVVSRKISFRGTKAIHLTVYVYCASAVAISSARAELERMLAGRCEYVLLECTYVAGVSFVQPELLKLIPPNGFNRGSKLVKWSWRSGLRDARRVIRSNSEVSEMIQSFCDSPVVDAPLIDLGSGILPVNGYTYQPDSALPWRERASTFAVAYGLLCLVGVGSGVLMRNNPSHKDWLVAFICLIAPVLLLLPRSLVVGRRTIYVAGFVLTLFLVAAGWTLRMPPGVTKLGNPVILAVILGLTLPGVYHFWVLSPSWRPVQFAVLVPFIPLACGAMATMNWRAKIGEFPFPSSVLRVDRLQSIVDCVPWYAAVVLCCAVAFAIVGWLEYLGMTTSDIERRAAIFLAVMLASMLFLGMLLRMSVAQDRSSGEAVRSLIKNRAVSSAYSDIFNVACVRELSRGGTPYEGDSIPRRREPVLVARGSDGNYWIWKFGENWVSDTADARRRKVVTLPVSTIAVVEAIQGQCP